MEFYTIEDECVWQLQLAHFGSLIWPTLGVDVSGQVFGFLVVYTRSRRRSCGNVESPRFCGVSKGSGKGVSLLLAFRLFRGPSFP